MALGSRFTYILLTECIVIKEQSKDEILWIVDSWQNPFSLCTSNFFCLYSTSTYTVLLNTIWPSVTCLPGMLVLTRN